MRKAGFYFVFLVLVVVVHLQWASTTAVFLLPANSLSVST